MGITFIWYLVTQTLKQYSQFNRENLNFVLQFKFLIYKINVLVKNDFWQDFVDFLIISEFSVPAILRTHMTFML